MKQLKKITWSILLLTTVFVACNKKSKNENQIAPKSALDGDYLLKQIQVAGQPLPEKLAVSQYLIPTLQNLSEEKKKIGVYVTSEIAKGFEDYLKKYPGDIDENATFTNYVDAMNMPMYPTYDFIYNYKINPLDNVSSLFDQFIGIMPLTLPVDLASFLSSLFLRDTYITYAEKNSVLNGVTVDKDGLYYFNETHSTLAWIDPEIAFRDTYLPMIIRMFFDQNTVKLIHKHLKPLILADGVQPQVNQMSGVIQALVSLENDLFAHPTFKAFNDAFAVLHNVLYNSISLEFLNNTSALDLKILGNPIYDAPAPLIFSPNSKDRFQAVFLGTTPLPNLLLDFKMIKQENKTLHLGLKDLNGLTSLLNTIDALKPKNETQRGIISNVMNLYKKINTFAKESAKKREHLVLNMLLEPASLKSISKYILPLLSKPRNNEVQDKSLIVLELEKND